VDVEAVYADPSALVRLYLHQAGSREMAVWRAKHPGALAVTHHGRAEMINALCRAAFQGFLNENALAEALADLDSDFAEGRLRQAEILWRAALNRAGDLSRRHTPKLGTRAMDVLHVGCAIELKMRYFLTFDNRQGKLAKAAGLRLVAMK
jgi:predicted nucleic acid-binding protein